MLRAFLHLARQVESSGKYEIRICPPNFHFRVESSDIDLCCCKGLLAGGHPFPESDQLCGSIIIIIIILVSLSNTLLGRNVHQGRQPYVD